jgi:uncharacterized membrane protein
MNTSIIPVRTSIEANITNVTDYTTICLGYSPIILSMCILLISFYYQTYQGILFFISLIIFSFFRKVFLESAVNNSMDTTSISKNNNKCSYFPIFQNSSTDGFNIFFITFVAGYFITPMLLYGYTNPYVIGFLIVYLILIIWNDIKNKCSDVIAIISNMLFGILSVCGTMSLIVFSGLEQYLFLQDLVSDATICSMPSNQTFKCSVYKNGILLGQMNK